jgi:UDP-2,4-diacetamido-2,4,6-trideoxy-beta-L-altropyranose hydrolase
MNNKNIVIRVDASIEIGSGHVMRCLTLATALRERGAKITFICRDFPGDRASYIRVQGFECRTLRSPEAGCPSGMTEPPHAKWLGASWQQDADEALGLIGPGRPEWLVVDHYGIDCRWEGRLRAQVQKVMVIDDLLDRKHDCDLILDQTLGREAFAYSSLVPDGCKQMMGSSYAMLRPEFARMRDSSLLRRENPMLRTILVNLGGVDKDNLTVSILRALRNSSLPADCVISVVMGSASPWLAEVRQEAVSMPWPTMVSVDVSDMAERMAASDLAIGAAGTTAWERCCLGLPTILFVLAENQREVARSLEAAGAAVAFADTRVLQAGTSSRSVHGCCESHGWQWVGDGG